MKKTVISFLFVSLLFLTSCVTTIDAYYSAKAGDYEVKTIYLVNKAEGSQEMDERIKKEHGRSSEAREIEKNIAKVKALGNL